MKRPWPTWFGFMFCLAVVLAAVAWISVTVLRVDRAETEARQREAEVRRQAADEENVRLALWRLDSVLAPFVAQESARPLFVYRPFLPIGQPYAGNRAGGAAGSMVASPLLVERPANIGVHFQFEPDGQLTSPQVPAGSFAELPLPPGVSEQTVQQAQGRLQQVRAMVDRDTLLTILPDHPPQAVDVVASVSPLTQTAGQRLAYQRQRRRDLRDRGRSAVEFNERNQVFAQNTAVMVQNRKAGTFGELAFRPTDVVSTLMTPLWIGGQLILARRLTARGQEYVQGCLVDWPVVKRSLLETIDDLLPEAELVPAAAAADAERTRMLATLPARLIPGRAASGVVAANAAASGDNPAWSPIWLSLGIAWCCVLMAAGAVGALLVGVVRLSERRAAFVSAVTHELRTPLTTFQMYSEMLAEEMVVDEQQRRHYLATLQTESARLSHLVENVLTYARIERGRTDDRLETISLEQLVARMERHLAGRAEQADMELVVATVDKAGDATVRVNVLAVEQIMFNLVDNACKYAAGAAIRRIDLTLSCRTDLVELSLRDHGSGVSPSVVRRLFQPFSKSAREAAHTAPGVGLGLALSRRLARRMGGELRFDQCVTDGARFALTLPAVSEDTNRLG